MATRVQKDLRQMTLFLNTSNSCSEDTTEHVRDVRLMVQLISYVDVTFLYVQSVDRNEENNSLGVTLFIEVDSPLMLSSRWSRWQLGNSATETTGALQLVKRKCWARARLHPVTTRRRQLHLLAGQAAWRHSTSLLSTTPIGCERRWLAAIVSAAVARPAFHRCIHNPHSISSAAVIIDHQSSPT